MALGVALNAASGVSMNSLKSAPRRTDNWCIRSLNATDAAMYASRFVSSPFSRNHSSTPPAQLYASVGVETGVTGASPHRLVSMLFDAYVDAVAQAIGALQNKQIELKCRAIGRAARIIDEGLKASLNLNSGPLAADLNELYAYVTLRLTQANLRNDAGALAECLALIQPLREAWASIAPQAPAHA